MAPLPARSVVITGVSTGIGHAAARACLDRGFRVFGTLRQATQAGALSAAFGSNFHPLLVDVTDPVAISDAARVVGEITHPHRLGGLINNAGIAVAGPLLHLPVEDLRRQLEVNLVAPLAMIKAFAPLLGSDPALEGPPGRVINITSVSGKIGFPFLGAYVASKHGLEGASESLRRELMLYGIDVIIYAPGAIKTPIWDKSDLSAYAGTPYAGIMARMEVRMREMADRGLEAAVVGRELAGILLSPAPQVRYAPVPKKLLNWTLPRLLPKRWMDRLIAKRLGLLPPV